MGRIREDTVLSCPFMTPLTCRKQTNSNPVSFRYFCWWCLSALSPRCLLNFHASNVGLVPALIRVMYEVTESRTGILQCVYRYFEEGCRKQCRRQSQWFCGWFWIHCSLKQFERMTRKAMDVCLLVLKLSNKSRFDSYSVRNSGHIPYYLSGLSRAHFFSDNLYFHFFTRKGTWKVVINHYCANSAND